MEKGESLKVYLAHGHHHQLDGKWLEHQIKSWGYEVYNPFDGDKNARELTKAWEKAEEKNDIEKLKALCKPIYEKDCKAIQRSDVVVAYYPDVSIGTTMEIPIGRQTHHKRVIVLSDIIHPFLLSVPDCVLSNDVSGLEQLQKLLARLDKK